MKIYKQYDELLEATERLIETTDRQTEKLRIAYGVINDFFELTNLQSNEREMYSEFIDDIDRNNECINIDGKWKEYTDMYRDHIDLPRLVKLYQSIKDGCDELHMPMVKQ